MSEWKETDIGKLPKSWEVETIAEMIQEKGISVGVMYPGNNIPNGVPLVRAGDVRSNKIDDTINYRIAESVNQNHKRTILQGGELLVVLVGSPGIAAIVPESKKGWNAARAIGVLKLKDTTDGKYISYALRHPNVQHNLLASCNTSVQATLNLKELKELQLPWPIKTQRTAIAEVLSSLDDKIDLLHRQNKTIEQLAETLFRHWFVEEADESWQKDVLDNLFDIGIGRTPPRKEQHWFSTNPNDVKWVSIKDMGTSGIYIDTTAEYLTQEAVDRFSVPVIPENTVMLSFKMTIGRLAISTEKMLSNEAIAHFKQKAKSNLFPEFLYLFLKTFRWEELGSTSSIVDAINSQMIKEMELTIPDAKKLKDFQELIKPTFEKIKANQSQIRTLTKLRDTLLPKLMSGEVRVEN